jgi:hypothetical protein
VTPQIQNKLPRGTLMRRQVPGAGGGMLM